MKRGRSLSFTPVTAMAKVRQMEDLWNSRNPACFSSAIAESARWRNRVETPSGRAEIQEFLARKWERERCYRAIAELWSYSGRRISIRFVTEWCNADGLWFRSFGNDLWEFDQTGLLARRDASVNDLCISAGQRLFHWSLGPRPEGHPGLTEIGI